jgi:hypothetical protein
MTGHCACELGRWPSLALDDEGTILSTKIDTGFMGTYFGTYAYAGEAEVVRGSTSPGARAAIDCP